MAICSLGVYIVPTPKSRHEKYVKSAAPEDFGFCAEPGAPNNSPAYALLGTKLSDGAIMGLYSENIPYYVDADGKCTKLIEKAPISSNNAFNTMEIRSINGKPYAALAGDTFFTYSTPEIHIVDVATKEVVFTPTTSLYTKDLIGNTGGDVTMEAAEGGLNIYYIANNASAIEAFHCPLK